MFSPTSRRSLTLNRVHGGRVWQCVGVLDDLRRVDVEVLHLHLHLLRVRLDCTCARAGSINPPVAASFRA
jgi:hypothetical protein